MISSTAHGDKLTRLIDDVLDPAGDVVRRDHARYGEGLDEQAAWNRLEARRRRRAAGNRAFALAALAAVTTMAVAAFGWRLTPERPALRAESVASQQATTQRVAQPRQTASAPARVARDESASTERHAPDRAAQRPGSRSSDANAQPETNCPGLAQAGRAQEAVACYEHRAAGSSLEAELALYEAARLRAEALRDVRGALGTLDEYRRRFPKGRLLGEVELAAVRMLPGLGRDRDALRESEALLDKPWGRENAAEIHLLRGRIYADRLHDCESALRDLVALLGDRSPAGDEAAFRRAECLDALGRRPEARTAYRDYLLRPRARRAAEAKRRLATMGGQ